MRQRDLKPGNVIRTGGSIFEIAQTNLFVRPNGRVMGGVVYPVRARQQHLIRGYCALAILNGAIRSRARVTVR